MEKTREAGKKRARGEQKRRIVEQYGRSFIYDGCDGNRSYL